MITACAEGHKGYMVKDAQGVGWGSYGYSRGVFGCISVQFWLLIQVHAMGSALTGRVVWQLLRVRCTVEDYSLDTDPTFGAAVSHDMGVACRSYCILDKEKRKDLIWKHIEQRTAVLVHTSTLHPKYIFTPHFLHRPYIYEMDVSSLCTRKLDPHAMTPYPPTESLPVATVF